MKDIHLLPWGDEFIWLKYRSDTMKVAQLKLI